MNLQGKLAFLMYPKQVSLSYYVRYMQKHRSRRAKLQSSVRQRIQLHSISGKINSRLQCARLASDRCPVAHLAALAPRVHIYYTYKGRQSTW